MEMNETYATVEPKRAEIDALRGPTLIEFGSPSCGHCRRTQPLLDAALASHPAVRHLKIEDAAGPTGAKFVVALPTG